MNEAGRGADMSSGSGVPAQAAALAELAFGASLGRSAVTLPTPGAAALLTGDDGDPKSVV